MGRPRKNAKGKAAPFADLDSDFKELMENSSDEDIKKKAAEVAFNESENQRLKKDDQDLAEKRFALKEASAQYSEASKMNKLRIAYARFILESRGKL